MPDCPSGKDKVKLWEMKTVWWEVDLGVCTTGMTRSFVFGG